MKSYLDWLSPTKFEILINLLGVILAGFLLSETALGAPLKKSPLDQIPKERLLELSRSRLWRQLLHFQDGLFSKSLSQGDKFFLAEERDPLSELRADIVALMQEAKGPNEHFSCLFPARARFILENLSELLTASSTPQVQCPLRDNFIQDLDIHGLQLLFASASFDHAASMFGHSMIRINRGEDANSLSDPVVSFVAGDSADGITEIIYGLTGQFRGIFEISTFAQQNLIYTVHERRHLWLIGIDVPEAGLRRFVDHLWEMNSTYFDYSYFNQNCAFYNQSLLQVALPEYDLMSEMGVFAMPQEAVQALIRYPDLINQIGFYPSALTVYERGLERLTNEEEELMLSVVERPQAVSLPPERAALVYKVALQKSMLKLAQESGKALREQTERYEPIARLLENTGLDPQLAEPDFTNPTIGAAPHSLSLYGGMRELQFPFVELEFRPQIHERFEAQLSYAPLNEIVLLKGSARYYTQTQEFRLQRFVLGSLYTLRPWKSGEFPLSWAFDLGLRDSSLFSRSGTDAYFEVSWGMTLPFGQLGGLSLLGGPIAEWTIMDEARAGAQAQLNLTLYPLDRLTLNIRGGSRYFSWEDLDLGQREDWVEAYLNLFIGRSLTTTVKARTELNGKSLDNHELGLEVRYHWF